MSIEKYKAKAWFYVCIQVAILVYLVFGSNNLGGSTKSVVILGTVLECLGGILIILSSINIRTSLTIVPLPKKRAQLSTSGFYKYVRHPIYSGVIMLSLGIAMRSGSYTKYFLVLSLTLLFYYKSKYEEVFLTKKFPEYKKYAMQTPRFVPFSKYLSIILK